MSAESFRFVVSHPGTRLDRLVADETGCGRRIVRQWLRAGQVRVDGHIAGAADVPRPGSEVVVEPSRDEPLDAAPAGLRVLFEDENRIAIFKPAGLHCERGKSPGSLAEMLEQRFAGAAAIGDRPAEGGLVHRIDRDTSGVVIAARSSREYRRLRAAFRTGDTIKHYLALASGRLRTALEIDLPLARRAARMVPAGPHDDAMEACTLLEPLDGGDGWTLVQATMRTGVMHQVRVHAAAAGHPLFGDALYQGPSVPGGSRRGQLLHAMRVQIAGDIDVSAGPPADFVADYARLRRS